MLPSFGRGEVVRLGFWTTGLLTTSGLRALVLPAVTLGLFQLTLVMRLVRSEMLEVLRTDYINEVITVSNDDSIAMARRRPTVFKRAGVALRGPAIPGF